MIGTLFSSLADAGVIGFADLVRGAQRWRVWHLLGSQDLRLRYARSRLGQTWLTLSTAITIGALSAVWSLLWNLPIRELMPFLGIGLIVWNHIIGVLNEATMIFTSHGSLYRNQKIDFSVSVYSIIYKNAIVLGHSLIIVVVIILAFDVPFNWNDLQIIPALAVTWLTLLWLGYIIALVCVRYRDVIQIINNWLQVLFFITPVMWKPELLPRNYHFLVDYNPLAQFLELLRRPLLGEAVGSYAWTVTLVIALGGGLLALPLIGRYQRRVIFWI